jgi:HK97 family phage portal protein
MASTQLAVRKRTSLVDMLIPRNQGGSLPAPTDDYWYESRGGINAGQNVTQQRALTFSGCWASTNAIAGLFGQLPCKVYKKTADGREEAFSHPVHRIVSREPNSEMDSFVWWEMETQWWVNRGTSYAEKQFLSDSGKLFALWPIHPSRVKPERNASNEWTGRWIIRANDGRENFLKDDEMFRIVGALSEDGLTGRGVVDYAAQSIGVALAEQQYKGDFYGNGGRPSGILEHPSKLSAPARDELRREWRTVHGKSNEVAVLWEGMKFNTISVDPEHAKLLDSQLFSIQEMSRFYDLPPHVLYELSKGTFANVEEMNRFLVSHSFGKRLVRVEKALDRQLFTESEKRAGYYTKFNVDALLRGNPLEQANIANILIGAGITNQDEERAKRDLNKIPDGLGKTYWVRRDMAPIDLAIKSAEMAASTPIPGTPPTPDTPPTPPVPGDAKAQSRNHELRAIIRRMATRMRSLNDVSDQLAMERAEKTRLQDSVMAVSAEGEKWRARARKVRCQVDMHREVSESLSNERSLLDAQLKDAQNRMLSLENDLATEKSSSESLQSQHAAASSKLSEIESELTTVRADLATAQLSATEALAAREHSDGELAKVCSASEAAIAQVADLQQQLVVACGSVNEQKNRVSAVENDLETTRNSLKALETERDELKASVSRLDSELEDAVNGWGVATAQATEFANQLIVLNADKASLEQSLADSRSEADTAKTSLVEFTAALEDNSKRLADMITDRNTAAGHRDEFMRQVKVIEKQQENTLKRLETTENALSAAKTTLLDTESAKERAEATITELTNRLADADRKSELALNKAGERADGFKSKCDTQSIEIGSLRAECDTYKSQVALITVTRDNLAVSLAEANKRAQTAELTAQDEKTAVETEKTRAESYLNDAKLSIAASFRSLLDESLLHLTLNEQEEVKSASRKPEQFKAIVGNYYHHFQDRLVSQLSQAAVALEKVGFARVDVAKIASKYVAESRTRLNNLFNTTDKSDLRVKVREETDSWDGRRQILTNWIGE